MPDDRRRSRRSETGRVTVQEVAAAAGVSVASVSRAINNSGRVGHGVRERVEAAIKTLGYVPHGAARALASQRSMTIGAVIPTLENPNFAIGVEALQHAVAAAGYTLLLSGSFYDRAIEYRQVEALVSRGVDGVMLVGADHDSALYRLLRAERIPFVNTWALDPDPENLSVSFDNKAAAVRITNFLLDLGHREFGVIAGVTKANDRASARVEGVREAMQRHGLSLAAQHLIERPYRIVDGQMAMRALLASKRRPTATICGNDVLAFGAMIECQHQGIAVPEQISIVGFDDLDFAAQLIPSLTTMRVPAAEIGRRAAELLLAAIDKRPQLPVAGIGLELIVRQSTAPPPRH